VIVAVVVASVFALGILLIRFANGEWGYVVRSRPMFAQWVPDEVGWRWEQTCVHDSDGRFLLWDGPSNFAVLVVEHGRFLGLDARSEKNTIIVTGSGQRSWKIARAWDTLAVALPGGDVKTFPLPAGFVARIVSCIPCPRAQSFDGDVRDLLVRYCPGERREDLQKALAQE
jgi:hypothetical protein